MTLSSSEIFIQVKISIFELIDLTEKDKHSVPGEEFLPLQKTLSLPKMSSCGQESKLTWANQDDVTFVVICSPNLCQILHSKNNSEKQSYTFFPNFLKTPGRPHMYHFHVLCPYTGIT